MFNIDCRSDKYTSVHTHSEAPPTMHGSCLQKCANEVHRLSWFERKETCEKYDEDLFVTRKYQTHPGTVSRSDPPLKSSDQLTICTGQRSVTA